jgi:acyl carrier protein
VLHVSDPVETAGGLAWLDWKKQKLSLAEVRRVLIETRPETLAIRNVPNARLDEETAAAPWLREAGPDETMSQLRAYAAAQPRRGVEPEDLQTLEELGYRVELSWFNTDAAGACDVVFTRGDLAASPALFAAAGLQATKGDGLSYYCNHPRRAKLDRILIPEIRQFLKEKLPHYMMPAVFTVLEKLPLSPTGKIDRRALEQLPVTLDPATGEDLPAGRNPLERMLLEAWADALNLGRVGLDGDFFELGGDSLKAVELTLRLERQLNRTIRPVALLHAPTVARFAVYLDSAVPELPMQPAAADSGGVALEEGEI